MATITRRLDGTPNELRQLIGQPDLLPLYHAASLVLERWLVDQVAALTPHRARAGGHADAHRGQGCSESAD